MLPQYFLPNLEKPRSAFSSCSLISPISPTKSASIGFTESIIFRSSSPLLDSSGINSALPRPRRSNMSWTLVAQLVVEALNVAVLPWGTRPDVDRLDLLLLEPVLHHV